MDKPTAHTPGPCFHGAIEVYPSNGPVPGKARCHRCGSWLTAPNDPVRAAAPDLLAALEDAVESLSRLPNEDGAYRVTCITQGRVAIRKAKGK
jgi:hypothetical protein